MKVILTPAKKKQKNRTKSYCQSMPWQPEVFCTGRQRQRNASTNATATDIGEAEQKTSKEAGEAGASKRGGNLSEIGAQI